MSEQYHPHSALIEQIGQANVMSRFDLSRSAVHNWRKRGIPHRARFAFMNLAASYNVPLPDDFMDLPSDHYWMRGMTAI